jgi:hypothetical protein
MERETDNLESMILRMEQLSQEMSELNTRIGKMILEQVGFPKLERDHSSAKEGR